MLELSFFYHSPQFPWTLYFKNAFSPESQIDGQSSRTHSKYVENISLGFTKHCHIGVSIVKTAWEVGSDNGIELRI